MDSLLAIGLCFALGALWRLRHAGPGRHPGPPPEQLAATLNAFAITVPLPALVLRQLTALEPSAALLLPALVPWGLLAVSAGLVILAARLLRWDRATLGALLLVVPLGNTAFLGLPLTEAWLGAEALPAAIVYDQAGSFVALALYGSAIVARFAPRDAPAASPPSAGATAATLARFPPFIAFAAAAPLAIVLPDGLPAPVDGALAVIEASLVPVVLVAVGLQWRLTLPRERRGALTFALVVKLVVTPLVAWALVVASGVSGPVADATVVEAAMGPMITAGALALSARLAPDLVAAVIGYGTAASLVTSACVVTLLLPVGG